MSKFRKLMANGLYELDGDGNPIEITPAAARDLVNGGEGAWRYWGGRPVIRPNPPVYPRSGVSASPGQRLMERYVAAKRSGADAAAVDAMSGWASTADQLAAT